MKYLLAAAFTISFMLLNFVAMACEVCGKQQPKILRGITHGAGPQSEWDYVAVWCIALIAVVSLIYAVAWTISPGEESNEHIKRSIFNDE